MNKIANDILMHYGVKRRSGRYPYGSGKDPNQHGVDILSRIDSLKKQGLSEIEISKELGMSTTELRKQKSIANNERRAINVAQAKTMTQDGYNPYEIGRKMNVAESTVRSWLNEKSETKMNEAKVTAEYIKKQINKKGMLDVGKGVEKELGVSKERLEQALKILEKEGYPVYGGRIEQVTNPGQKTTMKVICPKDTEHKEIFNTEKVHSLKDYTLDDIEVGETSREGFKYPASLDSKRLKIRYAEDGGENKDGVIELRRGVPDISLGKSSYSQIRMLVDNDRYLKGMAVYSDDLPKGVDVLFNTNKTKDKGMREVLKPIKDDPDNPFGSLIKENGGQSYYIDKDGKKKLSLINKRSDEGDWGEWADKLPSQFLSKQNRSLIKKQLALTADNKLAEFDEIKSYTNPTVKKALLQSFADDCDAAAVHLKAAALPRQKYQVILPINSLTEKEVYAPNYKNGETVALIRYPHGGIFEIPILKVNNKNAEGQKVMGKTPKDAVGINKKVADRLSGADFDGDTVMVVPCNSGSSKIKITSAPALSGLSGFDPKASYGYTSSKKGSDGIERYYRDGKEFKVMKNTQTEMGVISNLITDMTLKGAKSEELARAVRHSMVVIDAEKHKLDYKQSYLDNDIKSLKRIYQKHSDDDGYGGSSTLISRAKSRMEVPKRQGSPRINPDTGELIYKNADNLYYTDKNGNKKMRTQSSTKMAETPNAFSLSSGYVAEIEYANYANKMKALANNARKEMISTKDIPYSPSAKKIYSKEVETLNAKLSLAMLNKPREREAQRIANHIADSKFKSDPNLTKKEMMKIKQQALTKARTQVGAKRNPIVFSDREWEAIQNGAIPHSRLREIIQFVDTDILKERATPRTFKSITQAQINRVRVMKDNGYTTEQIAQAIGKSPSTVSKYL